MLAFKRRSDGFEWHRYIRTTIKVRRQDRKRRVVEARQAAVSGLKQAGRAGATAGAGLLGALYDAILSGLGFAWHVLQQVPGLLVRLLAPVVAMLGRAFGYAWDKLDLFAGQRLVQRVSLLTVAIGGTWAAARLVGASRTVPIDVVVAIAAVAVALFLIAVPPITTHAPPVVRAIRRRVPARLGAGLGVGLAASGALAAIVVAGWLAWAPLTHAVRSAGGLVGLAGPELAGRGTPVGADAIRVGGVTVHLTGVEVPLPEQTCGDRRRRCSALAEAALEEVVRTGRIVCAVDTSTGGVRTGTCRVGESDVGAALVRRGALFAAGGILPRYGSEEAAARAAGVGVWQGGSGERPSDFKARVTTEAQKAAPNGCAIKGVMVGADRRYLQPWDGEYARTRIRTSRGERWFCSTQEAEAAGFRSTGRS